MKSITAIIFWICFASISTLGQENPEDRDADFDQWIDDYIADNQIINVSLQEKLIEIIAHDDSLAKSSSIHSKAKSFWVVFYEKDDKCYVVTMSNFSYYDSKGMDGYFGLGDKIISVYDSQNICGNDFVKVENLKKGKIKELEDYNQGDGDDIISYSIPPHEPYSREYLIVSQDSLKMTYEGYR